MFLLRKWSSPFLLTLLLTGCGRGTGNISGIVKFNTVPLEHGTVTVISSAGPVVQAPIQRDGTFTARDVPAGMAKISVTCIDEDGLINQARTQSAASRDKG